MLNSAWEQIMEKPNILYIFTDQQSADAMSCAGNLELHTPGMDRLAEKGVRFERAYCSYPLCGPSRASMFTGRMPHEVGITDNGQPIKDEFRGEELGILLSQAGYECAYGGKWHVPEISIPEGHGFNRICGFDDLNLPERCAEFLSKERDKPFFLVASFDNPHNICEWRRQQTLPWGNIGNPPAPEDCPPLPPNFSIAPYEAEAVRIISREEPKIYPGANYTPEQWRRYRWAYYRLVERVDTQIGTILDALENNGLADNTVVIFSSDHGDLQGAHQLVQKRFLYDEAVRVPFIVKFPGKSKEGHVDRDHLVSSSLDFYATVCDCAGITPPSDIDGQSLLPLLNGEPNAWRDHVVVETQFNRKAVCRSRMVVSNRYTYSTYEWGAYREQLFRHKSDPGEMVNLAARTSYEPLVQQHREMLRDWCKRTSDNVSGHHYSHPEVPFLVPGDEYDK